MPRSTTLITGASGFAGGHLLERLRGRTTLVAWHRPGRPAPEPRAGLRWQTVDLLDREAVECALAEARPERVCHLAGAPRVDTAWTDVVPHLRTNVLGTYHLLEGIRRLGLPCRVVIVSSGLIYRPDDRPLTEDAPLAPASPYGFSKLAQDQLALRAWGDHHVDVVVARPFNHIGPRQTPSFSVPSFARQIALIEAGRAEPTLHVGNLEARRDLSDVRDVADAYERLLADGAAGRAYNICSGHAVRIGEVLDRLIGLSSTPVRVVVDPDRLRPDDTPVVVGDPARVRRELGWTPGHTLAETLRDTLDWWREQARTTFV